MTSLDIHLDGDNCWPDLKEKGWQEAKQVSVALLADGMELGAHSVTIRFDLPDGGVVVGQTSLALFLWAARAFSARVEGGAQ